MIWDKVRSYWEHNGDHIGNLGNMVRTHWKHDRNTMWRTSWERIKNNANPISIPSPKRKKNLGHAPLLQISVKKTPYTPPTFKFGIPRVLVSDPSQGTHFIFALSRPSLTPATPPPIDLGFIFLWFIMPPVTHFVSQLHETHQFHP
jgi:hypothetical protein